MESKVPLQLQELVKNQKKLQQTPVIRWRIEQPTQEDLDILEKESSSENTFDKMNLRTQMRKDFLSGKIKLLCMVCEYGKVLLLQYNTQNVRIPLNTWGRILQVFGGFHRVCWFAADAPRLLPPRGEQVGPEHINGGYTFPCDSTAIVIYREEEATRVLIHELVHATCLDPQGVDVTMKEAFTETLAELILVAVLSKGDMKKAEHLWKLQSQWIADQNYELRVYYSVHSMKDYAARYTIAREWELKKRGIELPPVSKKRFPFRSARFTTDMFDELLE